ncbi:MAG: M23 family metallopeptidase [Rhodobacterales bacterium]|nr:M23 family metallopeptidase [Rhodobacterales bacterium]
MIRLGAILLALVTPAVSRAFDLEFPIDCEIGETCYIQQFFDHDPGAEASDFTCGPLSYDGHDGTDIALPTLADQSAGVTVLAAAAGVVAGVRDEMADALQVGPDAPDVTNRECGNGVVIRHEGGWETQYCHMRLGSILVAPGQAVTTGTPLGQVGLSGQTQFPHLHLSVRHDGAEVDPFDPDGVIACGAPSADTLWETPLRYQPGGVISAGFADAVPEFEAVQAGAASVPVLRGSSALVAFGLLFGGQAGDVVGIKITGPEGEVIDHNEMLERTQAQLFRAAGRPVPAGGWAAGAYEATITLMRGETVVDMMLTQMEIPPG